MSQTAEVETVNPTPEYNFAMFPGLVDMTVEMPKQGKTYPPFVVKGTDAKELQHIFEALKVIVEECTFNLTADKVEVKHMDPSHVAMTTLVMPKECFVEYDVIADTKLCIDIADVLKLLKRSKSDETILLSRRGGTDSRFYISLQGKLTRNYDVPTLTPSSQTVPEFLPKLEFMANVKADAAALSEAFRELAAVAEQVEVKATAEGLTIKAPSEMANLSIPFRKDDPLVYSYDLHEESRTLYGLSFLKDMVDALKQLSDQVQLEFSTSRPCKLSPVMVNGVDLTYYLAPRIDE